MSILFGIEIEYQIERAVEWIEALAADEFDQTTGGMYNAVDDAFCCLGVAREISDFGLSDRAILDDLAGELLSFEAHQIGLCSGGGLAGNGVPSLITLNDDEGRTFPQIAHAMLSNPHAYFTSKVAAGIQDHFYGGEA